MFLPPRESLVSDIPAGDGKMANSFLQCRDGTYNFTGHQRPNFLVPEWGTKNFFALLRGLEYAYHLQ